ncbi:uncharacterized protein LOC126810774 [Patella vulgata]|uniref:uncharacterized protein LOC126810774 n=1 Tax=Patella vulgata TaxID=6465 RepID=UPI0024A95586|nr:uncharacterized protein LOC126810774 [Patella vulgata]
MMPSWSNSLCAFISWTLTSFLCHWTAKRFLKAWHLVIQSHTLISSSMLTLIQCLTCIVLVDVTSTIGMENSSKQTSCVKIVAHILATFCTNYSMTFMNAASTFTIKLLEPITSAVAQSLFQKISIAPNSLISLPIIVYGALLFTGGPMGDIKISPGTLLAFMSNIILAARNIAISTEQKSNSVSRIRKSKAILVFVFFAITLLIATGNAESKGTLSKGTTLMVLLVIGSGIFHVTYSYISTNIVLKTMTVFNHSILNICKRLLVVVLLYAVGSRRASGTNLLGFVICSVGLALHVLGKYTTTVPTTVPDISFMSSITKGSRKTMVYIMIPLMIFGSTAIVSSHLNGEGHGEIYAKPLFNNTLYDSYSPYLTTRDEIIEEAQRIHHELFTELLKPYKNVMLLDIALHENKGDPAITIGEMILVQKLNKTLVYYCDKQMCERNNFVQASSIVKKYTRQNLVILLHGGGNLVGWVIHDHLREKIFNVFRGFNFILFPQSIFMSGGENHLRYCENLYKGESNLTMILRDRHSLALAQTHFTGQPKLIMAPDMAFQIGPVRRFLKPFYDILWIHRTDREKLEDELPKLPTDMTIRIDDWVFWPTPHSNMNMENAYLIVNNGLIFLQRGRVVITDRLHGHILSTLLDIPHVIINNKWNKVSNYHNTWTKSLKNTRVANNASHAIDLARQLLIEYSHVLPEKVPFMSVNV